MSDEINDQAKSLKSQGSHHLESLSKPNVGLLADDGDLKSIRSKRFRETDDVAALAEELKDLASPIIGVVTTTQAAGGGTTKVFTGSSQVTLDPSGKDGADSSVHGKSQRSRFSLKSRKANAAITKQLVEEIQNETKIAVKEVQDQLSQLLERHEQGWDLVSINREGLAKMLSEYRLEGGFIGEHRYNLQDLDHVTDRFEEIK